jgi:hypothetical protein
VEQFGQISGVLFRESRCERQEIVIVGGHDQQPRPHVKGDGHAPQVPAGRDPSHGADRRYKILNLKNYLEKYFNFSFKISQIVK